MHDTQGAIANVSERPRVGDLITEFRRNGSQGDQFGRMLRAEDVRLARWDGQSEDGKKHASQQPDGDEVFPWEGASDVRNYLADGAINENVALLYMAFWNAVLKAAGAAPDDVSQAGAATEFLDWLVHFKCLEQLDVEVELTAQFMLGLGVTGLHVTWEREVGRRLQRISLEQLQGMGQAVDAEIASAQNNVVSQRPSSGLRPPSPSPLGEGNAPATGAPGVQASVPPELLQLQAVLRALPELVTQKEMEGEAVKAVQFLYGEYVHRNLPEDIQESEVLLLSAKRARECVRGLRQTGQCEFPMPYLSKNGPEFAALKPWRDLEIGRAHV